MGLKQRFSIVAIGIMKAVEGLAIFGFICAAISLSADAQTATATIAVGQVPYAVAVNPVTNKIYVANEAAASDDVTVIDGTNSATQTVARWSHSPCRGGEPDHEPDLRCERQRTVTVIDGATNNTTTVAVGIAPIAVAVNPTTDKIYVANEGGYPQVGTVTVIDGATNNTTTVAVGVFPIAVAVNPVTNQIYVANSGSSNVTVIDGATNNTATVVTGTGPVAVAVNAVTNKIYVANAFSNNVTVINGVTNSTTTVAA